MFLMPGVRGMGAVSTERHSTASPAVAGSRHEGTSILDREVFWPIHIFSDKRLDDEAGSLAWMERDRAFWRGMDPDDTGVWEITLPDSTKRRLLLRFRDDGDHTFTTDPMRHGWQSYGLKFVAERPFWEGDPVVRSWKNGEYQPFFEQNGPHLFNIGSGAEISEATIDNLGDVESYARWFIDGETTEASVGVNGLVVEVPFDVPLGKCLVIDSDPDLIGATMYDIAPGAEGMKPSERVIGVDMVNPVDRSADLGEADFAPIPPGASVPLSLSLAGTGAVEALLPSLYRRAW